MRQVVEMVHTMVAELTSSLVGAAAVAVAVQVVTRAA